MSAPDDCSPRLMWWDSLWRYVLVLAVSGLAWGEIAHREWTHGSPWFWVDLAGGLVSLWLVRYRRRWPFGIALTLTLFGLFSMSAAGPGVLAASGMIAGEGLAGVLVAVLVLFRDFRPQSAFAGLLRDWHFGQPGFAHLAGAAGAAVGLVAVLATCALLYRSGRAAES